MADAATTADVLPTDAGDDRSFLWRRLHSLSGLVPLGGLDLVTYRDVAAHLGNPASLGGLKGFCWTWGIAVGRLAQRRVSQVAWLLFALLSIGTLSILFQMRFGAVG
jgi:hypothetical protein